MADIDDATAALTVDEASAGLYAAADAYGAETSSWKAGAVPRTIFAVVAVVLAAFSRGISTLAKSGFLALASGEWLTYCARYLYSTERQAATFATCQMQLVNAGALVFELDAGDVTFATTSGKLFRNRAGFTLGPGDTLPLTIDAIEAGAASSAGVGTITRIVSPTMRNVTASNTTAAKGLDAERDADLKVRALAYMGLRSPNGPRDAYDRAARDATRVVDGSLVGINRTRSFAGDSGVVTTYVGTAAGAVAGDPDDTSTDLGSVADAIRRKAAPLGMTPVVASAEDVDIDVTITLYMIDDGSIVDADVESAVEDALSDFFADHQIGGMKLDPEQEFGTVYRDAIRGVIFGLDSRTFQTALTLPADDIELDPDQEPVLGALNVSIVRVVKNG